LTIPFEPSVTVSRRQMKDRYKEWAARWRVSAGFAFAAVYAILSQPRMWFLVAGGSVALAGLAIRAVSAGYIVKGKRLSTTGPFARSRNPLYLGSFVLGLGFAIASASWILAAAVPALFALVYCPVMRREEEFLRRKFGAEYEAYARIVPLFFPRPGRRFQGEGKFRWELYRKNREYEAAAGYAAIILFLVVKMMLR
jgi:protein-S-isoprenylcysteine O-methyltransferase Ste14